MGGLLVFFALAEFEKEAWVKAYWIWTMAKDAFFIAALYLILVAYRKRIFPVLFFSIIRLVWEILAQLFSKDINDTIVLNVLFYILLSIAIMQALQDFKAKWEK